MLKTVNLYGIGTSFPSEFPHPFSYLQVLVLFLTSVLFKFPIFDNMAFPLGSFQNPHFIQPFEYHGFETQLLLNTGIQANDASANLLGNCFPNAFRSPNHLFLEVKHHSPYSFGYFGLVIMVILLICQDLFCCL